MDAVDDSRETFRAVADRGACCGYGVCADVCPEVFKLGEAGLVYVEDEIVPPELFSRAKEAVESCPQLALRFVTVQG